MIGTIAKDLEVPWGIAFLPDGSALVTERDSGRVLQVTRKSVREVGEVSEAQAEGEAGLLGVAVSPSYAQDKRVFFYATAESDNRVLRTTFSNGRLGELEPILTGIPKAFNHDGGRMVFGPDRMLYVSTGEAGQPDLAQDRGSLGGKILRITQDGDPGAGNPDRSSPIWTWGHRNVQGLAFDDAGNLWASEFGQDTFDELNLIEKGRNYGWPDGGGQGRRAGFAGPAGHLVDRRGVPLRAGVRQRSAVAGRAARRAALAGRCEGPEGEAPRRASSSGSTAGCGPSYLLRTGTCGSPPPTATAAETRQHRTTGSCSSAPEPPAS